MTDDPPSSIVVLGQLLDRQVERRPDADAVTDGTNRLSWRGYRDATAVLAARLAMVDVGKGDRVAILLPKSIDSFVAVHAILRLGAVVVPVDWFAPADYARDIVHDSGAVAIVSTANDDVLAQVTDTPTPPAVVRPGIDDEADVASASPADVAADDDAYIVYTSGSTGRPKGIVHSHASALAYARAAIEMYELEATDRLVNVAPLHFDQSTFELYAAPLAGAGVIVLSDVMLRFPASASDLIARERATVWYSVPYAITQLTQRGALDQRDLSSMRWVLFGGESFQPGALAAAMAAIPTARFSNVYGPAEVNQCTYFHLDEPPPDERPVPIGAAWSAARLRVVDADGAQVTDGGQGELLVSTDTMMSRYWNRPDLTAESIVDVDGQRWYRTGDLVVSRHDETGDGDPLLVFLGRVDHQVKLRGHRIELEAVEGAVSEGALVDDCAVVVERAGSDTGDDDRLVALVAPLLGPDDADTITHDVRQRLPRYAVPSEIVGVAAIPRNRTGKIDRPAAALLLERHREIEGSSTQTENDQR